MPVSSARASRHPGLGPSRTSSSNLKPERISGKGSYVLQKVRGGKSTCCFAKHGGELHGPYWYHYWKRDRKAKSKYVGKNRPAEGVKRQRSKTSL